MVRLNASRLAVVYEYEPSLDGGHTSLHVGLAHPALGNSNSFLHNQFYKNVKMQK